MLKITESRKYRVYPKIDERLVKLSCDLERVNNHPR